MRSSIRILGSHRNILFLSCTKAAKLLTEFRLSAGIPATAGILVASGDSNNQEEKKLLKFRSNFLNVGEICIHIYHENIPLGKIPSVRSSRCRRDGRPRAC